ncbi:helicase C-terminal domain-containing protein [Cellulomonas hominis]|uniref:helicase C-terminal domain-containing protein n=1 Tax=Cellulomonas hominis TaxID=156981 RepID=UPI0011BE3663|nr:helicase C-terminal domain-containing protein [Cellulomonas hominis]
MTSTGGQVVGIAPTGSGKALDVDTPIPTPSGWTRMGDLRAGDTIYGEQGQPITVAVAHPVQHERPCYRVSFSDGTSIVADAEHLWPSVTAAIRYRRCDDRKYGVTTAAPWSIVTTEQMAGTLRVGTATPKLNHAVPVAGALQAADADLPVPPYILGAWLGDGTSIFGAITVGHDDLDAMRPLLEAEWPSITGTRRASAWTLRLVAPDRSLCPYGHDDWRIERKPATTNRSCRACVRAGTRRDGKPWNTNLARRLRALGVLGAKHIPASYLRASYRQRWALLQGLMDTDGSACGDGGVEFSVTDPRLADDVAELVRSLGVRVHVRSGPAKISERDASGARTRRATGTRYRLTFTLPEPPFRLPRKIAAFGTARKDVSRRNLVYVTAVEPVASRPVRCIGVDSPTRLFLAGPGLTPTHNSFSYGVPAGLLAATTGRRAVISTESLALQSQIIDKDAPVVVEAVKAATGVEVTFEVLKGWSNWSCIKAAIGTAHDLLGEMVDTGQWAPSDADLDLLIERLEDGLGDPTVMRLDGGATTTRGTLVALVHWVLRQHKVAEDAPGDRHSYPGAATDADWSQVSVSPSECPGAKSCPMAKLCKPAAAKERAARADVLVTNHSLLAVQASKRVSVVIGSASLGRFDAVIVDEAHALPGKVRDQGAGEVSGRRIMSAVRGARSILDDGDRAVSSILAAGEILSGDVQQELEALWRQHRGQGETLRLPNDVNPLADTGAMIEDWVSNLQLILNRAVRAAGNRDQVRARRIKARLDSLKADASDIAEHRSGVARWVQENSAGDHTWLSANLSPVDVSGALQANVWTQADPDADPAAVKVTHVDEGHLPDPGSRQEAQLAEQAADPALEAPIEEKAPRIPLSVVAVSATLPAGFARQAGLSVDPVAYESPFGDAYRESMLYVPSAASAADVAALSSTKGGRPRFEVTRHLPWALEKMPALVDASGGGALILSATAAAGRRYAEELRTRSRGWAVHSQWDGPPARSIVAAWKADTHSILIGTRSLMTGVDAPGETNRLVIVDRVPRAAANPVDDARVEDLIARTKMSEWAARDAIYAVDAALLLEQAVGRMIRSTSDRGLVAVLDPRLLKGSSFSYNEPTRRIYMGALAHFGIKTMAMDDAVGFLRQKAQLAA